MHKILLVSICLLAVVLLAWKPFVPEASAKEPPGLPSQALDSEPEENARLSEPQPDAERSDPGVVPNSTVSPDDFLAGFVEPRPGWQEPMEQTVEVLVVDAEGNGVPHLEITPWYTQPDGEVITERSQRTDRHGRVLYFLQSHWNRPAQTQRIPPGDTWHFRPEPEWLREASVAVCMQPGPRQRVTMELTGRCVVKFALFDAEGNLFEDNARIQVNHSTPSGHLESIYLPMEGGQTRVAILPFDLPYRFEVTTTSPYRPVRGEGFPIRTGEESRQHDLQLGELAPAITFHLYGPDGQPFVDSRGTVQVGRGNWFVNTDSVGFARVPMYEGLPAHVDLLFQIPEHYTARVPVPSDCQPGDRYLGRVDLIQKPILASGTILLPNGTPVPWAKVAVTRQGRSPREGDWHTMSGKDGNFHLYKGLPEEGPYELSLESPPTPGFDLPAPVPFVRGQTGLILRLTPIELLLQESGEE